MTDVPTMVLVILKISHWKLLEGPIDVVEAI